MTALEEAVLYILERLDYIEEGEGITTPYLHKQAIEKEIEDRQESTFISRESRIK
jgi:predicted DNA-binding protein